MRPDQIERIAALTEQLADVFIREADPSNWTAPNTMPADMTKDERGNRFWDRKGASATGSVLRFAMDIIRHDEQRITPADEADVDEQIAQAEQRASAEMRRVLSGASNRAAMNSARTDR